MTSLAAISFTLVGGIGMFTVTLGLFGSALKNQSHFVAARCTARPPAVIYNPNPSHPCQRRGNNPMFGWILWVMRLSYDTLLQGVPGTGTRRGGLTGTLLKVNLDGIVLLRFHHLCLRIAGVAAVLYLCVMLPLYATAACSGIKHEDEREGFFSRDVSDREAYCLKSISAEQTLNLTDYQRLTLANIPVLYHESLVGKVTWGNWILSFFLPKHHGLLARLYAVVFCSWIVTWYTMRQLTQEWKEVLAMRRVYYLEADLWQERQEEMERIGMEREDDFYYKRAAAATKHDKPGSFTTRNKSPTKKGVGSAQLQLQRALYRPTNLVVGMSKQIMTTIKQQTPFVVESKIKSEESRTKRRDPWVPHPEQGDTVPNIGLYSILVGGLPALPTEVRNNEGAVFSRKQSIDWQLSVATAFFDHCVPNQPGFSSSVAAVTVLPESSHLTEAWGKWYVAAAKLRRLRFIRQQIADLEDEQMGRTEKKRENYFARRRERRKNKTSFNDSVGMIHEQKENGRRNAAKVDEEEKIKNNDRKTMMKNARTKSMYGMGKDDEKKRYKLEILGSNTDLDVDANLLNALDFGPEQSAVYSREFAQASAALAPNGCCAERIRFATMDELIVMEQVAVEDVHEANEELRAAQEAILNDDDEFNSSVGKVDLAEELGKASSHGALSSDRRSNGIFGWGGSRASSSDSDDDCFTKASSFGEVQEGKIRNVEIDFGDDQREKTKLLQSQESSQTLDNEDENMLISTARAFQKQITEGSRHIANMTGVTTFGQNIANIANIANLGAPARGTSAAVRCSDVTTAQLPDHLGLEAGLWMKSRNSTIGRHSMISRSSSAESATERSKMRRSTSSGSKPGYGRQSSNESDRRSIQSSNHSTDGAPMNVNEDKTFWNQLEKNVLDRSVQLNGAIATSAIEEGSERSQSESNWDRLTETARNASRSSSLHGANISGSENVEHVPLKLPSQEDTINRIGYGRRDPLRSIPPDEDIRERIAQRLRLKTYNNHSTSEDGMSSDGRSRSTKSNRSTSDKSMKVSEIFESESESELSKNQPGARLRPVAKKTDKWPKVTAIVRESSDDKNKGVTAVEISDGRWQVKTWQDSILLIFRQMCEVLTCVTTNTTEVVDHFDDLARDSTYAVVTFTSRQAAVAARHCLADSRGGGRWVTTSDIPIPPLADGPPFNLTSFRGCMRPVTITINDKQKLIRSQLATVCVWMLYFFYTIPLVAAQQLVEPDQLRFIFPDIDKWQEKSEFIRTIFSGIIPALVWTGFFALCPIIFKAIANFGSNATSLVDAENSALKSFWWFMVLAAFSGTSLSTAMINGFSRGVQIGAEVQQVIEVTARSIPSEVSATWLNWIIVRMTFVLPTQYLLQMNSYLFSMVGMHCCSRAGRGGGAGGPIPYRVYVDSGVVMLCLFALAPASPLISAAVLVYFIICIPLFRWAMIFQYKPKFDIGGGRFPILFDMCISGMIVGQILLAAMMSLKSAVGPALTAAFPVIPTIVFRFSTRKKYLRAFSDAALLQTSLLDGWDTNEGTSQQKREEFRQFLVDSHRAAYVPVCIAGDNSAPITTEPAVVVPLEIDEDFDPDEHGDDLESVYVGAPSVSGTAPQLATLNEQPAELVRGAVLGRAQTFQNPRARRVVKPNSFRRLGRQDNGNEEDDNDHNSFTLPLTSDSPSMRSLTRSLSPPQYPTYSPEKQNYFATSPILMSPTRKSVAPRFIRGRTKIPESPAL